MVNIFICSEQQIRHVHTWRHCNIAERRYFHLTYFWFSRIFLSLDTKGFTSQYDSLGWWHKHSVSTWHWKNLVWVYVYESFVVVVVVVVAVIFIQFSENFCLVFRHSYQNGGTLGCKANGTYNIVFFILTHWVQFMALWPRLTKCYL